MKKPAKKLTLNKETLRVLNADQLAQVGGGATTAITCTCPRTSYCTTAPSCGDF